MVNLPAGAALGVAGADLAAVAAADARALLPASGDLLVLLGDRLFGLLAVLAAAGLLGSLAAAAASAAAGRVPACRKARHTCRTRRTSGSS
jgi:hypothetical protein